MLTDKAKIDFEKWLQEQEVAPYKSMFWDIPIIVQMAYIIEWFDSIDYYINIEVFKDKMLGYVRGFKSDVTFNYQGDLTTILSDCLRDDVYESRTEATKEAIQKANELYNTTHP